MPIMWKSITKNVYHVKIPKVHITPYNVFMITDGFNFQETNFIILRQKNCQKIPSQLSSRWEGPYQ